MVDNIYGLIVAGGSGTRLWPLSRPNRPKQLLPLGGGPSTLLQDAFLRLGRTVKPGHILTVTSAQYDGQVLAQLRQCAEDLPPENILVEPVGRDSAPAVLWGALRIHHACPGALMAVVWADQMIRNEAAFDQALRQGCAAVRHGGLAAVGVVPNRPATTLGYIKMGPQLAEGVFAAERFVEKPDLAQAEQLLRDGSYLWNAGVFVFHVQTLLDEFERLVPTLVGHFRAQQEEWRGQRWTDEKQIRAVYARLERSALDYALLERTDQLRLIPADLEWSDLGAWNEIYFQRTKDDDGNAVQGRAVTLDTRNTLVLAGRRLVAAVGVEDLVVVDTEDALLVCSMKAVQDVKRLVVRLQEQGHGESLATEQSQRPWGHYAVLTQGDGYKVKVLEVLPHQQLSLQVHRHRAEHWLVVQGQALLTRDEQVQRVSANGYFFVPAGSKHRIANPGDEVLRIIEVQNGAYLGEDDILRFQDDYGRA